MENKRKCINDQDENNVITKKLKPSKEFSEKKYSEEEDTSIIKYLKENTNWNQLKYSENIYENCQKCILKTRSATSIKSRFLNVILPNLHKYQIVDTDEIPLFYDRAGIDIPLEMEQILVDLMETHEQCFNENHILSEEKENIPMDNILCYENDNSSSMEFVLNNEEEVSSSPNGKINMTVQTDNDIEFQIKSEPNKIFLNMNGQKYIFIPNTVNFNSDQTNKSNETEYIHYIDPKKFNDIEKFAKLNNKLDKRIFKSVENEKVYTLNTLRLLPLNYEKLRRERLLCSCEWEISKKFVKPSVRRKSKTVHLPLRSKKNKEIKKSKNESMCEEICSIEKSCKKNIFLEKVCKCCTDVSAIKKNKCKKKLFNIHNEQEKPIVYLPVNSKNTKTDLNKQKMFTTLNKNGHVRATNENNEYPETNIASTDVNSSLKRIVKFADVNNTNTNNENMHQMSTLNSKENNNCFSKNCAILNEESSKFINSDMSATGNEKDGNANDKNDKNTQEIQTNDTVMDEYYESDYSSPIISMYRRINKIKPFAVDNSIVEELPHSMDDTVITLFTDLSVEEQGTNDSVTEGKQKLEQFEIEDNKIGMCSFSDKAINNFFFELLNNSNNTEENNSELNKRVNSDISDTILKRTNKTYEVPTLISQKLKSKNTISSNDLLTNACTSNSSHTFLSNKSMKYLKKKNLKRPRFMLSTLPKIDLDNNKSNNKINTTLTFSNFDEHLQIDVNSRDLLDIRQSSNT